MTSKRAYGDVKISTNENNNVKGSVWSRENRPQ